MDQPTGVGAVPLVAVGSWSALLQWTLPALLPVPISRAIHRFKLTHYRNSVLRDAGRRMLLAVKAYYSPGKGVHGLGSGGGGLSPSQMLRSGPPTFPCPQLTIQKVWQTLESQPTLGPGEAGPGLLSEPRSASGSPSLRLAKLSCPERSSSLRVDVGADRREVRRLVGHVRTSQAGTCGSGR